jgi:hypothetical protein
MDRTREETVAQPQKDFQATSAKQQKQINAGEIETVVTHALALGRAPALFLQIPTELPPSAACFLPSSRSDHAQRVSSQLCDGSIKAEHGTPSTTSCIAPFAKL